MVLWMTSGTLRVSFWKNPVLLRTASRSFATVPNIAHLLHGNERSGDHRQPAPAVGDTVRVNGFISSIRKQRRHAFAAISDGSTVDTLQVLLSPEQAELLSTGQSVAIDGTWQASPAGKEQSSELHARRIELLGANDVATYPVQKKFHTREFLRTLPHLRMRTPSNSLLLRTRSQIISSLSAYFNEQDFVQIQTPIITSTDCEGAGEVFTVSTTESKTNGNPEAAEGTERPKNEQYFGSQKYLTVSSQLHLEAAAQAVSKVWTLGPTFRAEKSDTVRHLSEFYMLEAELAFIDNLTPVMDLLEGMLRHVARDIQSSRIGSELLKVSLLDQGSSHEDKTLAAGLLRERWRGMTQQTWPRITHRETVEKLKRASATNGNLFASLPEEDGDLRAEHEKYIASTVGKGSPVFVTDYPRTAKPFYMSPSSSSSDKQGGSLREHREQELMSSMKRCGLAPSKSQWYLDLRRYGSVPHGGFGLGLDRLIAYITGVSNVRDVATFPRWYGRCDC